MSEVLAVPDAPRSHATRAFRYLLGAVLGAAGLYACFASVEWPQFVASFQAASVSWVIAAAVSILLTLAVVTTRSVLFLDAGSSFRVWRGLWDAVIVGQAVNIVVPLRFGEGARVAFTCSKLGLPAGRVLVGMALERIFDVSAFAVAVLLVVLSGVSGWMPGLGENATSRALVMAVATVAAVAGLVWLVPIGARSVGKRFSPESSIGRWIEAQQSGIRSAWAAGTRPHLFLATVPLTALMTIGAVSTNLLVFRAFDLELPIVAGLALLVVLQIGTTVVSVPGNLGVFHYLTVVTLGALQVPRSEALAVAVVLHAVAIGPKVVLAAIALAGTPVKLAGPHRSA
ncbi:MAG: hypothetical protein A3H95_14545 [Acidobacteria bacterium RIFCSPLOWO2_02_FULL_64_15]|nr:MAG: hypothetical protein A3H95_14545 [Acidobacteria bacterium RIFCSPLOWO2_02_FULL_64_15]